MTLTYEIQSEIHVRVFTLGNKNTMGSKFPPKIAEIFGLGSDISFAKSDTVGKESGTTRETRPPPVPETCT